MLNQLIIKELTDQFNDYGDLFLTNKDKFFTIIIKALLKYKNDNKPTKKFIQRFNQLAKLYTLNYKKIYMNLSQSPYNLISDNLNLAKYDESLLTKFYINISNKYKNIFLILKNENLPFGSEKPRVSPNKKHTLILL